MSTKIDTFESVHAQDRRAWRKWLEKNHASAKGVWLEYFKKSSGKPSVTVEEAVEEALCFGWIDSKMKPIDAERFRQVFTPRKTKSIWSKINKARVAKLIKAGLMTPAGLERVKASKRDGSWNRLDAVEALVMPEDFRTALRANPTAEKNFTAFNDSAKKIILWWIVSAKRPETREKRIRETVALAEKNVKAGLARRGEPPADEESG